MYCAEALIDAFPDAKIVQIIRDGRDVVAAMMSDPDELAWFRRGIANVETEFPNPFFGTETEEDRDGLAEAVRCGQVRDALARLGAQDRQAAQLAQRRPAHHASATSR